MKFIRKNRQILILVVLAVAFFFVYSYLSFKTDRIFNSPDETANFYFSKIFAKEGVLWQVEPFEFLTENSIFPRSIKTVGGKLVPVGFLGMPVVYGVIAKIIGIWSIKFMTPFFAVLAVLAFYGIIRRIFEEKVAFFSAVLMFALPPFWYYAERGMFHNVLFLSFLIFSIYFFLSASDLRRSHNIYVKLALYFFGGMFLSLALMTRLSEIWWIAPVLIALIFIFRKNIFWRGVFVALAVFILFLIPFLAQNKILYGSPFATGYQSQIKENQSPVTAVQNYLAEKRDAEFIFPFGINLRNIIWSGWNYFIMFFPWLVFPAIFGAIIFLSSCHSREGGNPVKKKEKYYFGIFCFVALWLFVYYGSWRFSDNPDPSKITIGTSYLRYWLPVFVMILPFFPKSFLWISEKIKIKFWKIGVPVVVVFFVLAFNSVFYAEGEGIMDVKTTLARYEIRANEVFNLTEYNSVIVTDRNDKMFFPNRKIVYPLRSENTYGAVLSALRFIPVYYYGIIISEKENFNGLGLELIKEWGNEAIYEIHN